MAHYFVLDGITPDFQLDYFIHGDQRFVFPLFELVSVL